MFTLTYSVAVRVIKQLFKDRRLLVFSIALPLIMIYAVSLFFEGVRNPLLNPKEFAVRISAFTIHFVTYVLCIIGLVRERTTQTLARMFVNGYPRSAIILGYIAAYSGLATLQSLVVLLMTRYLFELDYSFTVFLSLYGVIWMLAVISLALGILVSNFADNEGQAIPFIPLVIVQSMLFSGVVLPIERLPDAVEWLAFLTPLYYANEAEMAIIGNANHNVLWVIGLPIYGLVIMGLAMLTLRESA